MSMRSLLLVLALILTCFLVQPLSADCKPENNTSGHFKTRYGIPEGTDFDEIYKNPSEYFKDVRSFTENGKDRIIAESDFHALYPGKKEAVVAALMDVDKQTEIFYRVVECRLICMDPGPPPYYKQYEKTSFKFLGLGADYEFIMNIYEVDLDEERTFATKWNLEKSLEDSFHAYYGSWYFKDIEYRGRPHTYMRYYTYIDFKEIIFGLKIALLNFTSGDIKGAMKDLYSFSSRYRD